MGLWNTRDAWDKRSRQISPNGREKNIGLWKCWSVFYNSNSDSRSGCNVDELLIHDRRKWINTFWPNQSVLIRRGSSSLFSMQLQFTDSRGLCYSFNQNAPLHLVEFISTIKSMMPSQNTWITPMPESLQCLNHGMTVWPVFKVTMIICINNCVKCTMDKNRWNGRLLYRQHDQPIS